LRDQGERHDESDDPIEIAFERHAPMIQGEP
jgi:hypothetical protein